jgi:hypothetical protein
MRMHKKSRFAFPVVLLVALVLGWIRAYTQS